MNVRNNIGRHLAHMNSRPRHSDQPSRALESESERLAVAISAQTGSGALQVAEGLAEYLHTHSRAGEPPWGVPPAWMIAHRSIETILSLVRAGNVILVGWGAIAVASKLHDVFHVRLVASLERRIARIQTREHLGRDEALAFIERSDRGCARYVKRYFHREVADVLLYGLVINTDHFADVEVVRLVGDAVLNRQRSLRFGVRIVHARETLI